MNVFQDAKSAGNPNLKEGQVLFGKYRVLECLGVSAKTSVYRVQHVDLDSADLALKVLNPQFATSNSAARFQQEVVASYSVTHPNVVRTHEFLTDGKLTAYTMEYMDCGSLKEFLEAGEPVDFPRAVEVLIQICLGLKAIHDAGIIHRNIKPGNLFVSSQGLIKIADFGIAKQDTTLNLTMEGEVLDTVGYASPEYLQTGHVDQRSDIYAVGMIGYELVTGRYPFTTSNPVEGLRQRLTIDPPSPLEIRPDCPLELSIIIRKALQRDPIKRYQSAKSMAQDLKSMGIEKSLRGRVSSQKLSRVSDSQLKQQPAVTTPSTVRSSRLRVILCLGLVAFLVIYWRPRYGVLYPPYFRQSNRKSEIQD